MLQPTQEGIVVGMPPNAQRYHPKQPKIIGPIRARLEKWGLVRPWDRARFLTITEADKLMDNWRKCRDIKEFITLAKVRPCTASGLRRWFDGQGPQSVERFMKERVEIFIRQVRDLLRKEELSFGIGWASGISVLSSRELDRLVFLFVECSKVADCPCFLPDPARCEEYWFILRRVWPASKQRTQSIVPPGYQGRLDAWVDD